MWSAKAKNWFFLPYIGAWSWRLKFFMIFSLMILAGRNAATGQSGLESTLLVNGRERRRMPTRSQPSERANFAKEHGRGWQGIWHRGRVIWSRRTRALK